MKQLDVELTFELPLGGSQMEYLMVVALCWARLRY